MTKRSVTAKPSPLPCIYYFAFSADHIDFVATSLATYFHQDPNRLVASGNDN